MVHDTNGNVVDEGVSRWTFTKPAGKSLWAAPIQRKNRRSCDLMARGLRFLRLLSAHGNAGTCTPGHLTAKVGRAGGKSAEDLSQIAGS